MKKWTDNFRYDPIAPLVACDEKAVSLFAQRDLVGKKVAVESLWEEREPIRILRKQKEDGSWTYPGGNKKIRSQENYNQIETYRSLGILVEEYGFNRTHPAIEKAAEFIFSFQTKEGDIRGIYGHQYTPNYTAGIAELLIKAGYERDARIKKVMEWLISIRQNDGGWAIPMRTHKCKLDLIALGSVTMKPDVSKPYSHMVTGVVLRAFAAHDKYRNAEAAGQAGSLLLSNLFKRDHYPDRATPDFWLRFSFPFWFTDLISAMDSLSLLGFSRKEPQMDKALKWFIDNQQKTGLWELKVLKGHNRDVLELWLSLAICRIFKRLHA